VAAAACGPHDGRDRDAPPCLVIVRHDRPASGTAASGDHDVAARDPEQRSAAAARTAAGTSAPASSGATPPAVATRRCDRRRSSESLRPRTREGALRFARWTRHIARNASCSEHPSPIPRAVRRAATSNTVAQRRDRRGHRARFDGDARDLRGGFATASSRYARQPSQRSEARLAGAMLTAASLERAPARAPARSVRVALRARRTLPRFAGSSAVAAQAPRCERGRRRLAARGASRAR